MKLMHVLVATCVGLALNVARGEDAAPAAAAPAAAAPAAPALTQKHLADAGQSIEEQLKDIKDRLDSISKFLGDRQSSTFDTVDRRLRDIERTLDDVKREVERLK